MNSSPFSVNSGKGRFLLLTDLNKCSMLHAEVMKMNELNQLNQESKRLLFDWLLEILYTVPLVSVALPSEAKADQTTPC